MTGEGTTIGGVFRPLSVNDRRWVVIKELCVLLTHENHSDLVPITKTIKNLLLYLRISLTDWEYTDPIPNSGNNKD